MMQLADIFVTDFQELEGQIVGKVQVASGGKLVHRGQIVGGLVIDEGGQAEVHGQICCDVTNNGLLKLTGQIIGKLHGKSPTGRYQVIRVPPSIF